jgi:(R,R)-butanediol dehydrogenase/meso-butanediol dehydrogenase/diacetyl reductase
MGHEASGVVDAVGANVSGIVPHEEVTFIPTVPCDGGCGHVVENRCSRRLLIGCSEGMPGAFAEYVVVPATRVVPLDGLSLDDGAYIEPMAVGLHAAHRVGVRRGESVLVVGGGTIGLAAAQASLMLGASTVTISEPLASRRQASAALGIPALDPSDVCEVPLVERAVDAVGTSESMKTAIGRTAPGGTICLVGLGCRLISLSVHDLAFSELTIVGADCYSDREFLEAREAVRQGRMGPRELRPRYVTIQELGNAMQALVTHSADALRVVMAPDAT